jgi:hypothetical protein
MANTTAFIQSKSVHSRNRVASVRPIPANASAMKTHAGTGQERPPRVEESEQAHDGHERGDVGEAADERPPDLAEGDVPRPQRRVEDAVVDLHPLELGEHVDGGLGEHAHHGGVREDRRGDVRGVGDRGAVRERDVPDERADPEPEGEQEEQGLHGPRDHEDPGAAHGDPVAVQQGARGAEARTGGAVGDDGHAGS